MTLTGLLAKISNVIINPLVILGFVVATIVFFYGIIKFISNADDDASRKQGKDSIVYGVIGLVVMFSVFGILHFVLKTFGIDNKYPSSVLP